MQLRYSFPGRAPRLDFLESSVEAPPPTELAWEIRRENGQTYRIWEPPGSTSEIDRLVWLDVSGTRVLVASDLPFDSISEILGSWAMVGPTLDWPHSSG